MSGRWMWMRIVGLAGLLAAGCGTGLLGLGGRANPLDRGDGTGSVGAGEGVPGVGGAALVADVATACSRLSEQRRRGGSALKPDVASGLQRILGCGDTEMWPEAGLTEDPSSAVASVGWVGGCLAVRHDGMPDVDLGLASFAVCGGEARAITQAAFAADLAKLGLSPPVQARAMRYFGRMKAALAAFDDRLAPRIAKDRRLREVFYGASDQAWIDARANAAKGARERAAVAAFDLAVGRGRSAAAGCVTALRDTLAARLRAAKVKTVELAELGSRDAVGQPVTRALQACAQLENQPAIATAVDEILSDADDLGGARGLAYWYAHDATVKLAKDGGEAGFEAKDLPMPPRRVYPVFDTDTYDDYVLEAPVRSVTRSGAQAVVSFAEVRWKERETDCHDTDQADSIDEAGKIRYRRECRDLGVRAKRFTEAPVVVAVEHAGALAPGRAVEMRCDGRGERRSCFPAFVWSDAKKQRLVGYLGATL